MSDQQASREDVLSFADCALRIRDEHKGRDNDGILRDNRITATDAAIKAQAMAASGFDLDDVSNEIFRRAKRINSDWFSIDVAHSAPLVCMSPRKESEAIHTLCKADRRIKFSRGFYTTCSGFGTGSFA